MATAPKKERQPAYTRAASPTNVRKDCRILLLLSLVAGGLVKTGHFICSSQGVFAISARRLTASALIANAVSG